MRATTDTRTRSWSGWASPTVPDPNLLVLPHPVDAALEVVGRAVGVSRVPLLVARDELAVAALGGGQGLVRYHLQVALDLPDVARREAPVVAAQLVHARQPVAREARRRVHVGLEVAVGEVAQRAEDREAPVQPEVARARHGTPAPIA